MFWIYQLYRLLLITPTDLVDRSPYDCCLPWVSRVWYCDDTQIHTMAYFIMIITITGIFMSMAMQFRLNQKNKISWKYVILVQQLVTPGMFLSLDILVEYRMEHDPTVLVYLQYIFSTVIFNRGVSDVVTDCPREVWCRGFTTCFMYVSPLLETLFAGNSWSVSLA